MNKQQLIKKWEREIAMYRRCIDDNSLCYTPLERTKAAHYIGAISAVLSDIKLLNENKTKTDA